jgi:type I restriction enzyme S subunit
MNDDLPTGWAHATIGDIAEDMKNGLYRPASSYADDGVACLRMYNIEAGKIAWKDIKRMKLTPQEVKEYQLVPGDLLVNRVNSRELVGKSAVILNGLETCVFESKNIRLRLRRDAVCPEFVNYKLLLSGSRHFTHNAQQVVGMASISQPQIAAFEIPLAPLAEQRRIVAKLEALLAKVQACQKRLDRIPTSLKRFRQAVLYSACSGRLTADWREEDPKVNPAADFVRGTQLERKTAYEVQCAKAARAGRQKPKRPKNEFRALIDEEADGLPEQWCVARIGDISDCLDHF